MKKNSSSIIIGCTLGSVLLACGAALAVTFSWFSNGNNVTRAIEGNTAGAYFASGKGTEDDPYIINKPVHLYNLAWLQYIGYFNKDSNGDNTIDSQYYFKLGADITMTSEWTLPPIGTEQYPFIGNFDGADHTITGLKISTQIGTSDGYITKHPSNVTETDFNNVNINIVGFFGIIGSTTSGSDTSSYTYNGTEYTYTSSVNSVKGIYLDDVTINAYATNTLCGMLAGYVNGELTNSGVHYGSLKLASGVTNISGFTNVSSYTLIGDYNKEKYKWETTPGGSGGGDAGYNTSINVRNLNDDLVAYGQSDNNNGVIKSGVAIPFQEASNASFVTKSGTVTIGGRTVTNASTVSVSSTATNIGYYVGGTVASNVDTIATMRVFKDHYTSETINYDDIQVSTNSDVKTVPDRVKTYLQKTVSGDVQQGYSVIRMGTPNTLSTTMTSDSGYYGIENGKVGSYSGNILVPNNCIWVAPIKAGTFEFVCTTENTRASYLYIWKLKRSTPKDYSTSLSTPDINNQATNFSSDSSAEVVGMQVYPASSPYKAYYYGTPITDDDINNGVEFAITMFGYQFMSPSIFITYIDIGSDGGGSGTTDEKTYSWSFDFVDKDDSGEIIKINDTSYVKTNLAFTINGTSTTVCSYYFRRTGGTMVYYFIDPTTTGFTITADGTTSNAQKAKDSDCSEADTTSN